jgi:hypothetical protein
LEQIELSGVPALNNDHVLAPDGRHVYVSANDWHIYEADLNGGPVCRVTNDHEPNSPQRLEHEGSATAPATAANHGLTVEPGDQVPPALWATARDMDSGAGQYECCSTALQNVRRQRDVRGTVWPLSEQLSDATPATDRQLAAGSMQHRTWCEQCCQFIWIPEHGRILEHGLELLR